MKCVRVLIAFSVLAACAQAQTQPVQRPRIFRIDHVCFYTTNPEGLKELYAHVLGLSSAAPIEAGGSERFMVGAQWIGYGAAPDPKATDRMDHVAFATDDLSALRDYLSAKGIKISEVRVFPDHSRSFFVADPEGHRIEFVERAKSDLSNPNAEASAPSAVSRRMIHTGFLVHNRDLEDHFYREILGFHLYWHGGMRDNTTDWVAMQVPDGTDWLEYMLNHPEHPDLKLTGVMNHISLGVRDMKQAEAILESHGWKPHGDEHSQMGKDGKWQLNVFDPDHTRVELMEFKPTQKPCCSDFTGTHPSD